MSAIAAKWISSFVLFICTVAVSVVPVIVFNYFAKRKQRQRAYSVRRTDTFNISSISSNHQATSSGGNALSTTEADNDSITGSGENVIRRTRSNSIGSISSISSRKLNKRSAAILQIFMFFGGGVLLATSFCHLIPEVKENYEKYMHKADHSHHNHLDGHIPAGLPPFASSVEEASTEISTDLPIGLSTSFSRNSTENLPNSAQFLHGDHEHEEDNDHDHEEEESKSIGDSKEAGGHSHNHGVPWVEIAVCGGFFLIYFIEEIVHTFVHNHSHGADNHEETYKSESIDDIRWDLPYQSSKNDSDAHLVNNPSNKTLPCYDNYAVDFNSEPQIARENAYKQKKNSGFDASIEHNGVVNTQRLTHKEPDLLPASVRFMQGLVIIIAFSAHSVFDGVAIGLQSSTNQVYKMLFAISMHKFVVAFAVGLEIFGQTSSVLMTTFHMVLFSIMSPIGIWIMIFSQERTPVREDESLFFIMLSAVATGTIIYIVFFEILQKDRSGNNVNGLILWLIMLSGFALMLSVNIFVSG